MSNMYLYERMVGTRHAEVHRDMHLRRKASSIIQSPPFGEHTTDKLGTLLVETGSRLRLAERRRAATVS